MAQRIFVLILCLFSSPVFAGLFDNQSTNNFVPASKAFQFDFQQQQQHLMLHWQIKPGFYLYKKQIKLTPTEATLGEVTFPQGESHHDEFFGDSEVYRQQLTLPVTLQQASQTAHITVTWQGCSDRGVCYPPESQDIPLSAVAPSSTPPAVQGNNPGQQTNAAAQFTGGKFATFTTCRQPVLSTLGIVDWRGNCFHSLRVTHVSPGFRHYCG